MTTRHRRILGSLAIVACLGVLGGLPLARVAFVTAADPLPDRISDAEFWQLVTSISEPSGTFRSDNLLSNEIHFQKALPSLIQRTRPGRAYLGVGPEQNFTYALALRPAITFVVDLRRANLDLHLLYKAIFELSTDRAEFVSRLFSRPRPLGLGSRASVGEIFAAVSASGPREAAYTQNMSDIRNQLLGRHRLALPDSDLSNIEIIYRTFFTQGPAIRYSPNGSFGGTTQPTYAELMAATDEMGNARGFLASEAAFTQVKDLQSRNLIVPVVGDFAGPKAIRAIGQYLRDKGAMVSAFYLSNVEEYLVPDGVWRDFCANVATLPLDETSTFIRSVRLEEPGTPAQGFMSQLRGMAETVKSCDRNGP